MKEINSLTSKKVSDATYLDDCALQLPVFSGQRLDSDRSAWLRFESTSQIPLRIFQ